MAGRRASISSSRRVAIALHVAILRSYRWNLLTADNVVFGSLTIKDPSRMDARFVLSQHSVGDAIY